MDARQASSLLYRETALALAVSSGSLGDVYYFEPIPEQAQVLRRNSERMVWGARESAMCHLHGASLRQIASFISEGGGSRADATGEIKMKPSMRSRFY